MRFVAKYRNFTHGIRSETAMVLATGRVQVIEDEIIATFRPADVLEHEKEYVLKIFTFSGMPTEVDEVTPIDPGFRLSAYDSVEDAKLRGWDDDTREMVEQKLLESPSHGVDFVMVPALQIPIPWPSYDEIRSPKRILALTRELGIDPEFVLRYERNNEARDDVIAALQAEAEPEPQPDDDLVEA